MPKLSIITVNLNNKSGFIDTAESVIAQTWTDYEWIIIDGGSTDGSVDVIKNYVDKTDRLVYWCSEPDGGIYQGMNKGIEKASGEYCWFLNSGDYAYKNTALAEIFADEFDEDIVYGNEICKFDRKKYLHEYILWDTSKYKVRSPFFWAICGNTIPHAASLINLALLKKIGGYSTKYRIISDRVFFMKSILELKARVKFVPIIMSFYDTSGISAKNISNNNIENTLFFKSLFPKTSAVILIAVFIFNIPSNTFAFLSVRIFNFVRKIKCFAKREKYLPNNKHFGRKSLTFKELERL